MGGPWNLGDSKLGFTIISRFQPLIFWGDLLEHVNPPRPLWKDGSRCWRHSHHGKRRKRYAWLGFREARGLDGWIYWSNLNIAFVNVCARFVGHLFEGIMKCESDEQNKGWCIIFPWITVGHRVIGMTWVISEGRTRTSSWVEKALGEVQFNLVRAMWSTTALCCLCKGIGVCATMYIDKSGQTRTAPPDLFVNGFIKGSLDEKLPIYEQDPKSKRLDSFEKRFVWEEMRKRLDSFEKRFGRD